MFKHNWIGPKSKPTKSGLYIFKKTLNFDDCDKVIFRLSADTRYRFYVNGNYVCEGPCQSGGDVKYYEEVDITPFIKCGTNDIEVKVWHILGKFEDFIFTGALRKDTPAFWAEWEIHKGDNIEICGTDDSWDLEIESSYKFIKYIGFIHPNESDGLRIRKKIKCAIIKEADRFALYGRTGCKETYPLMKSPLPQMRECSHKSLSIVKEGKKFAELDAGKNVTAKLKFKFFAEQKTAIKIFYSECYYKRDSEGKRYKEKRDDSTGELYNVLYDSVVMEAGEKEFEPLWWKSFRFIRIESDQPIRFAATYGEYCYPIDVVGDFSSPKNEYKEIFDVSIQTLKNCMHEVFIDCPFFEQQQYCMDTALESLFAMTLSNDYRLTAKAISDIACSQDENGFLAANWPSHAPKQIITTFSIFWILLLNNYLKYSGDKQTVKKHFGVVTKIIEGFESLVNENGVVGKSKFWEFLDWVPEWNQRMGHPYTADEGAMSVYSMMFSYGLGLTSELAEAIGRPQLKEYYLDRQKQLNTNIVNVYYDKERQLFKDTEFGEYSAHTAVWSVLCGIKTGEEAKAIIKRAIEEKLPKPSFSMNFFYFRALEMAGLYQDYFHELMNEWKEMLALNATTWFENKKSPRSDCHGWSATPIYELVSCVAGIRPIGFNGDTVRISPIKIDGIDEFSARLPFKDGVVELKVKDDILFVAAPHGVNMLINVDGMEKLYQHSIELKI